MSLITLPAEITRHLPVAVAGLDKSMPDFSETEEQYLVPILGDELYQVLQDAYNNALAPGGTIAGYYQILLSKSRAITVPFAYAGNLPFIQLKITASGLKSLDTDQTRGSYKWEYNKLMDALLNRGYDAQEKLISYLKKNADQFPEWQDSPYNAPTSFAIIRDGSELRTAIGELRHPHRCYAMLLGIFTSTVTELYLKSSLGSSFYQSISARIIAGETTDQDNEVLPLIRMAAARFAMKHAATELNVKFDDNGFTVVDSAIKDQETEGRTNADSVQLNDFKTAMSNTGNAFLDLAKQKINSLASDDVFPEYFHSDKYIPINRNCGIRFDNRNRRAFRM